MLKLGGCAETRPVAPVGPSGARLAWVSGQHTPGGLTSPCGLGPNRRLQDNCARGRPLTRQKSEWQAVAGM